MNLRRFGAFILAGALAAGSLAGCSGGNDTAVSEGKEMVQADTKASGSNEKVTLRFAWWGDEGRHEATLKAIELYMDRNPNVTIEAEYGGFDGYQQKISTQLAGQTAPDIIQLNANWMPDYANKGDFFLDLRDYPDLVDISGFDEEFLKSFCVFNEQLIALPTGMNARTAYINQSAAEKFGLDISLDDELTWEDYIEMGKKVQEQDPKSYLLVTDPRLTAIYVVKGFIQQKTGEQIINDDYTIGFDKEVLTEALGLVQRMYDERVFEPIQDSAAFNDVFYTNPKVASGELLASFGWTSNISELNGLMGEDNIQVIPIPVMEGAKDTALLIRPAQVMSIPASCENREEALKFLNFFFNDEEAGKILGDVRSIPSVDKIRTMCEKEGILDSNSVITIDYGIAHGGMAENGPTSNTEVEAVFTNAVEKIAYHKGTPDEVAEETMKLLEDVLNTLK